MRANQNSTNDRYRDVIQLIRIVIPRSQRLRVCFFDIFYRVFNCMGHTDVLP